MSLLDQIIADAPFLVADWGEDTIYTPKGGQARKVSAIVDRGLIEPDGNSILQWKLTWRVTKADVPTPNINGDTVQLKERLEDSAPATFRLSHDLTPPGETAFFVFGLTRIS